MATYEELMQSAEQIRTNELPESNTHELVGQHLKNQVEHFNKEGNGIKSLIEANKKEVDGKLTELGEKIPNTNFITCSTLNSVANKTVNILDFRLSNRVRLLVKMVNANTADNANLSISSPQLDTKPLYYNGERASSKNSWEAGAVLDVYYDGANFQATDYSVSERISALESTINGISFVYGGIDSANGNLISNKIRVRTPLITVDNEGDIAINVTVPNNTLLAVVYAYKNESPIKHLLDATFEDNIVNFNADGTFDSVILSFKKEDGSEFSADELEIFTIIDSGLQSQLSKLKEQQQQLNRDLYAVNMESSTDGNPADLSFADEQGNVLAEFKNGHVMTKHFDSSKINSTEKPTKGKIISVLADSISTYKGWLPSDREGYEGATYATYYPTGDVTSVNDMWWKIVADELGLEIGSICAWSGSRLIGDATSTESAECAASDKRIEDLGINGTPNIIISFIGINDMQKQYNTELGDLTSKDLWPENTAVTTISQGYGLMLSKILKKYPLAKVFCCTLFANASTDGNVARDDDGVYPTKNANGLYLEDINAKIRELAIGYGARLIELSCCGIHWGNISSVTVDGVTHPKAVGQKMIAEMIKNEILRSY